MRKSLAVFCPLLFTSFVLYTGSGGNNQRSTGNDLQRRALTVVGCAPLSDEPAAPVNGKFIPIMPGWGRHSYKITTGSDSAQLYFNQGLTMYYSYHGREALASFREAARFDSTNAMVHWGQTLAMGPSYNFGYAYKMRPAVPAALEKMNRYAAAASPKEKDLIRAMNSRYNATDTADKERNALNSAYADAMKPLVNRYTDDAEVKALYTDAVMLIHPWDFWNNDGTPKAWTPELVRYCEDILARDPQHPAALHYYIHLTEASRQPQVALASADSLIRLFPGVAHMVHMSSHEYERLGHYAKGVNANEEADKSLVRYDSLAKSLYPASVHVPHYYAVETFCAMSGGMYKKGVQKALTCRHSSEASADDKYAQYLYLFPELAMVRLGKWQDILSDTTRINEDWTYASLLNYFARGMAFAKTGNLRKAEEALQQLRQKAADKSLAEKFDPISNRPSECAAVAENILLATIHFQQKKQAEALAAIEAAIRVEDGLIYAEPKDWILPARQYLGAFLLQMNKPQEAEKAYREDLAWNPGNGWSLLGLHQALKAQGKTKDLAKIKTQYLRSFSEADELPPGSVY